MTDLASTSDLTPARRRLAFYVLLLGALMPSLNMFVVTIALPSIREGLQATASETSLIVAGYSSAYAVFLVTGGRLGDLFGRRLMFVIGMTGFTLASLLCGLAPTSAWLVTARILQGFTAAMMAPAALASVRVLFVEDEIAWALNIYGTAVGIAVAGGQFLGGMLVAADLWGLGWRVTFLINVPIGIAAIAAAFFLVPESGGQAKPRLDWGGVILLSSALATLILPLTMGREQHWSAPIFLTLALSPFLVVAFFWFERRLTRAGGMPILDMSLLGIVSFRWGLLTALLFFFTTPFYLFFSLYLQAGLGQSALEAGLAVLPYGVANFVGPMMATRTPARWRPYLFGIGMALEVAGYAGVALCAATQTGGPILFTALFVGGFGQGIAMPEMINFILGDVPHHNTGLAAGIMNSTLQIGAAISVASLGSLFFAVLGDGTGPADYGIALGIIMGSQVIILTASLLLGLAAVSRPPRLASRP